MVADEDCIDQPAAECHTRFIISPKRSFEAAKAYRGKKVTVLNFANNHAIGGAPFYANAQEESLCRCSTLYPCLKAMSRQFYLRHQQLYRDGKMDYMGNDDLIFTPDVVVFKSDERTKVIEPQMLPQEEWYKVNVITCAAPELMRGDKPSDYEASITSRIKKILDVAAKEKTEVLILGAWGCGAFRNPPEVVARVFFTLLRNYDFETVEFAITSETLMKCFTDVHSSIFASTKETIISLLESTGRENINNVIDYLCNSGFFESPASVSKHNNFKGGLAKHSLEVCREALKLNKTYRLSESSVIICSLLHDVCKIDQYVMCDGLPVKVKDNCAKGHGRRSMFIIKRGCQLPLNYDEEMAIWWHMGQYEVSLHDFGQLYQDSLNIPLCTLIRQADSNAAAKALTSE